jgi:hypothetical protein
MAAALVHEKRHAALAREPASSATGVSSTKPTIL